MRINIVYFLYLVCCSLVSLAQNRTELELRKAQLTRDIEMLNHSIKKMSGDKKFSIKQLQALNAQLHLREQKINAINSEINLLDKEISQNTQTVYNLQTQLEQLKREYAQTIRFAHRNQNSYSKLMFIFASKDFNQAYRRVKYLQQFGEFRQKQAKQIQKTQQVLHIKIIQLDHNKEEKKVILVSQVKEKKNLGKEKKLQETVVLTLNKQEKELKKELKTKQKEAQKLNQLIQIAIRKEIEEAKRKAEAEEKARAEKTETTKSTKKENKPTTNVLNATPETAKLSADFLDNKGRLPWPVGNGVITQGMGITQREKNVTVQIDGVLIQTTPESTVRAVFSGEVVRVLDLGNSTAILIRHGEYFTVYGNLKSASVSKGQKVSTKQSIGIVLTDSQDGIAEIKFGLWKGSTPQNPEYWLAK